MDIETLFSQHLPPLTPPKELNNRLRALVFNEVNQQRIITMTTAFNPLRTMIADGQSLLSALADNAQQFELAIEQRQLALSAKLEAQSTYDAAEAEFLADLAFSAEPDSEYSRAKNAEARKMAADRALVQARSFGPLRLAWAALNDAKTTFENAAMAYDQMEVRWKATRVAAELSAQMLRAASV